MLERCPSPIRRREFLQLGALTVGGLSLRDLLAAREAAGTTKTDTSVILLYLHGGASQLETWDLKPDAPSSYRSVFRPIQTNIEGIDICEHFPRQAKIADKFSLIRTVHHDASSHSDGGIVMLTGKRPTQFDPTSTSKSEHPDLGGVVSHARGFGEAGIPPYVSIPRQPYMTRPTYLGGQHASFDLGNIVAENHETPHLKLTRGRDGAELLERRTLIKQFDRWRRGLENDESLRTTDKFQDLAIRMLTSASTARAFDLEEEDEKLRDRYGRHLWGQGCLLARRLAEAGTSVISLFINTPKSGYEFTNWDDHPGNAGRPGHFGQFMEVRLPYLDEALSALIEDIYARQLDQKIMVLVMGEFGRTPRISARNDAVGRDHWPQVASVLVSGGGLRTGQAIGVTTPKAEYPIERPCTPQDLLATVYQHLGIDYHQSLLDFAGRPVPILLSGEPIHELL